MMNLNLGKDMDRILMHGGATAAHDAEEEVEVETLVMPMVWVDMEL